MNIRVRFTKNYKRYRSGDTATVSRNEAAGLFDSGVAIKDKVMITDDMQTSMSHNLVHRSKR